MRDIFYKSYYTIFYKYYNRQLNMIYENYRDKLSLINKIENYELNYNLFDYLFYHDNTNYNYYEITYYFYYNLIINKKNNFVINEKNNFVINKKNNFIVNEKNNFV